MNDFIGNTIVARNRSSDTKKKRILSSNFSVLLKNYGVGLAISRTNITLYAGHTFP